jgi:hypothetical protein
LGPLASTLLIALAPPKHITMWVQVGPRHDSLQIVVGDLGG